MTPPPLPLSRDDEVESDDDDDELTGLGSSVTTATNTASRRRSSGLRVLGSFEKAIRSQLDTKAASALLESCVGRSPRLAPLLSAHTANAAQRLVRLLSLVVLAPHEMVFEEGAHATFLLILLSGELIGRSGEHGGGGDGGRAEVDGGGRGDDGGEGVDGGGNATDESHASVIDTARYTPGAILGDDSLAAGGGTRRLETVFAGERGATIGVLLFSEISRAELFDAPVLSQLRKVLARGHDGASGGLAVSGGGHPGDGRLCTPSPRLEGLREAPGELGGELPCVDELQLSETPSLAGGQRPEGRSPQPHLRLSAAPRQEHGRSPQPPGRSPQQGHVEARAQEGARPRMEDAIASLIEPEAFVARHAQPGALRQHREQLSRHRERDLKIYLTQEVYVRRDSMSAECADFLQGLLTRDTNQRLGCGPGGCAAVKAHPFFASIDWQSLEEGRMPAPYLPKRTVNAKDEAELKHFNTKGMKELSADDQRKWHHWEWTSKRHHQYELAAHLYESWLRDDRNRNGNAKRAFRRGRTWCPIM